MLGLGLLQSKQLTPDELNAVRKARTEYQDYLVSIQTNSNSDVKNNVITPETGISINNQIQSAYDWLKKNPNATINEVLSNKDSTTTEIQRLLTTDLPKRKFYNSIIALPTILNDLEAKKQIDKKQILDFENIIHSNTKWYEKHKKTATQIDFDQEMLKLKTNISKHFKDAKIVSYIQSQLEFAQQLSNSALESNLNKKDKKNQKLIDQTINLQSNINNMFSTAIKIFFTLVIIVLCMLSGSYAANLAIGRVPAYRILYFIYGCIPLFVPFILIYAIYTRIRDGRIPSYTILPLSIEPATTRLGRFLWKPFYWIPDQHAIDSFKKFQDLLSLQVV